MSLSDLVVYALPHGVRSGPSGPIASVTAYFAPRLREDGVLSDYPAWVDWPATVAAMPLQVWGGGVQFPATAITTADSTLWRTVFAPDTPVEHYSFDDRTPTNLVSFDGATLGRQIEDLYAASAVEFPDGPPSAAKLAELAQAKAIFDPTADDSPYREAIAYQSDQSDGKVQDPVDEPDVHEYLGMLSTHPELLRMLGLAIDLEFPVPASGTPANIQIRTSYPAGRTVSVQTLCTAEFWARPDPDPVRNDQVDGYLRLDGEEFAIGQGATNQFVARSQTIDVRAREDERDASGAVPPLPSGAIQMRRTNQLQTVHAKFQRATELAGLIEIAFEGAAPPEVHAEDLTIGYRWDVWDDDSSEWHSVFQRRPLGPYDLPRNANVVFEPDDDEGMHQWTLWSELDDDEAEEPGAVGGIDPETGEFRHPRTVHYGGAQRVDPNLFTWGGWSAAAPRPSNVLDLAADAPKAPEPTTTPADQGVRVSIDHQPVPGTLPRLRFGRTYRLRARTVDVTGTSKAFEPDDVHPAGTASDDEFYGRLERIDAPSIVRPLPKELPGVGESTLAIVLKSDYDVPDSSVTPQSRVLFPPKVAQYLCELHGLPNGGVDPTRYADLAARDATSVEAEANRDAATEELVWADPGVTDWVPRTPNLPVSWLPDPITAGITVRDLPGGTEGLSTRWAGTWPAWESGLVEVRAGGDDGVARPDPETFFRIWAPKAEDRLIQFSCSLDNAGIAVLETYASLSATARSELEPKILGGQHWQFGASLAVRLVHAVQRPLRHPSYAGAAPTHVGTQVSLNADTIYDGKSTGNMINHVRWIERIDDGVSPDPLVELPEQRRTAEDFTGRDPVEREVIEASFDAGTTRRFTVIAQAEAVSRFWQYFHEYQFFTKDGSPATVAPDGIVLGTVTVTDVASDRVLDPADYVVDHDAGTIEVLVGATGREYRAELVPRPISRLSTEQPEGARVEVIVPSSVQPDAVPLADLVPAYRSRARERSNAILSERDGRTFRVWLDRPWFSSGEGELLAVVIDPAGTDGTTWARDPHKADSSPGTPLRADDFVGADGVVNGVQGYDLATYRPTLDVDRNQYYVDITVAGSTSSRPWIAPVLARYQPESMPGAELSVFTRPDPFRLGARRQIRVRRLGNPSNPRIAINVRGDDHAGIPDASGGVRFTDMRVVVQERDPAVTDDALAWYDVGQLDTLGRRSEGRWASSFRIVNGSGPYRLLLTELEPTLVDDGATTRVEEVPVFVETIEIPDAWATTTTTGGGGRPDRGRPDRGPR